MKNQLIYYLKVCLLLNNQAKLINIGLFGSAYLGIRKKKEKKELTLLNFLKL